MFLSLPCCFWAGLSALQVSKFRGVSGHVWGFSLQSSARHAENRNNVARIFRSELRNGRDLPPSSFLTQA